MLQRVGALWATCTSLGASEMGHSALHLAPPDSWGLGVDGSGPPLTGGVGLAPSARWAGVGRMQGSKAATLPCFTVVARRPGVGCVCACVCVRVCGWVWVCMRARACSYVWWWLCVCGGGSHVMLCASCLPASCMRAGVQAGRMRNVFSLCEACGHVCSGAAPWTYVSPSACVPFPSLLVAASAAIPPVPVGMCAVPWLMPGARRRRCACTGRGH